MYKIGALTSKISAFKGRPWELKYVPSLDVNDTLGSKLLLNVKGRKILRAVPSYNPNLQIEWVSDKSRYSHEAYIKHRLNWAALKVNNKYKKVSTYSYVRTLIQTWIASQSSIDIVCGTNLSLEDCVNLKLYGRHLGAHVVSEKFNYLIKTFNKSFISNKNLKDLDQIESCIFVGLNPRLESPIGNLIFRLRYLMGNFRCMLFGNAGDFNYSLKNYGSKSTVSQDFILGKHIQNIDFNTKETSLVVYGDSCSERNDCNSWLKMFSDFYYKVRLSTHVGIVGQDYLNFGNWEEKNSTYFVLPIYSKSLAKVKNIKSLVGSTHLQEFLKNSDFFYPVSSYLEKNTFYLGYDGKLNYSYKAINPLANSLSNFKDVIGFSINTTHIKKTFFLWKKSSLQQYLYLNNCSFINKNCDNLKYSKLPLKIYKSPLKAYIGNAYAALPIIKISSTLMQLTTYHYQNYFSFL